MKTTYVVMFVFVLSGCVTNFPENPTQNELDEMHELMNHCIDNIVPLEKHYKRKCKNVEKALIANYGSLDAFMKAQRNYK